MYKLPRPEPDTRTAADVLRVLEHLSGIGEQTVDRQLARKSLAEAQAAWPGDAEQHWWKWLVESGHSLGRRFRVIDCAPDEALALMQQGARVAVYLPDADRPWVVAVGSKRRRVSLCDDDLYKSHRLPFRAVRNRLRAGGSDLIRIVFVDSARDTHVGDATGKHFTPWGRLRALLRPEMSDVWIVFIFALFVGFMTLATPVAVEALVNTVAFGRLLQPVVILAALLFGFLAFAGAMRAFQTWVVEIIQRRLFARVAGELAYRLPRVEATALRGEYGPELVNRFFDVVTVQKVSAQLLLDGIALALGALIGFTVLAFYHPFLLAFDLLLLVMILFIIFGLGRGAVKSSIKESKSKYKTAAWLQELARCPTAFRFDGAPEFAVERADHLVEQYLSQRRDHYRILFRQILFALTLQAIASTVLLGLGGWLVISGELTLGQLVAAELIVTVIVGSFAKLGKHMESFYDLLASVDKLGVLFDLRLEPQYGAMSMTREGAATLSLHNLKCGGMRHAVNLRVEPGDRLAIVGPEGSGKTPLTEILFGLGHPTSGHAELDGLDLRDLRRDVLRHHVALVRGMEVFGGTIAENVALERSSVSHTDVRNALEAVGLLGKILALPDGLDTKLVTGGQPLNRTMIARLMLARAIAGSPRLLVIDCVLDALSDADGVQLAERLLAPENEWTIVIATGRAAIANMCNRRLDLGESSPTVNRIESSIHV